MPVGCTFYLDRKPENCLVNFDANLYDRNGMRVLLDRYHRLLETVARNPELPIRTLLTMIGAKPLRWKCESFYEFVKSFYRCIIDIEDAMEAGKKMALAKRAEDSRPGFSLMPSGCGISGAEDGSRKNSWQPQSGLVLTASCRSVI